MRTSRKESKSGDCTEKGKAMGGRQREKKTVEI